MQHAVFLGEREAGTVQLASVVQHQQGVLLGKGTVGGRILFRQLRKICADGSGKLSSVFPALRHNLAAVLDVAVGVDGIDTGEALDGDAVLRGGERIIPDVVIGAAARRFAALFARGIPT